MDACFSLPGQRRMAPDLLQTHEVRLRHSDSPGDLVVTIPVGSQRGAKVVDLWCAGYLVTCSGADVRRTPHGEQLELAPM